ncbi:MAG: lasso RiPP family leader peptide-containing protein [Vicinamibacterales bacterium]
MTTTRPVETTDAQKKPYEPPRLDVYGDIRKVTQTVGNTGSPDGGHGAHGRTG